MATLVLPPHSNQTKLNLCDTVHALDPLGSQGAIHLNFGASNSMSHPTPCPTLLSPPQLAQLYFPINAMPRSGMELFITVHFSNLGGSLLQIQPCAFAQEQRETMVGARVL